MADQLDPVEAGLADPDPWQGFASVEAVGVMQERDHGIADLVSHGPGLQLVTV
jgi:hypothetical protein